MVLSTDEAAVCGEEDCGESAEQLHSCGGPGGLIIREYKKGSCDGEMRSVCC